MAGLDELFVEKEVRDPNYEGWKKIYESNPDIAEMNENHAEYLERYTLEMSTSDAGEAGILGTEEANMEFVEVDDGEEVMVDDRINLMAAAPEKQPFLSSDQSATTLFMNKGGLTNYLKENAPKGEFLAYINPDEATMLKKAGGSGKLVNGIPSFEPRSSREADQKSSKSSGGDGKPNIGEISGTKTETKTETKDPESNREDYRTKQYTTGPKTRTKTVDSPKLHKITGKKVPTYTIQTPFSPKTKTGFGPKGKDTWHETAVKNINKNIKDVDRTLNPSPFGLLDVVLAIGSLGVLNPATTKAFKTISNIKTGLTVANLVSDPTKTKSVKDMVKDVLTSTAKKEISKKTGIDVDVTLDTIQKALDTKLGKSVVDKFNSLNTTNKNTTKNNTTDTTTFDGGNNDGPNKTIAPVVPELIAEDVIIEEPTSSLSNMATLDLLRDRQNRRRSFFNANSGGLAGLFKVKKQ